MVLYKARNEVSNVIQNVACLHDKYDDNTNDYVPATSDVYKSA